MKEQRKLALTRAYLLLKQPEGTVGREDWTQLMSFLRPDCDRDHVSHFLLLVLRIYEVFFLFFPCCLALPCLALPSTNEYEREMRMRIINVVSW